MSTLKLRCVGSLLALAMGSVALAAPSGTAPPIKAQKVFVHADPRVGTYVSAPWGFSTSSYWIEGPSGLILIDTQFLLSAAEEALSIAEAATQKKVELAIVLHANPDKFNGTDLYRSRGIRVVTSEQVRALIPAIHEKRVRAFYERYKPDYPDHVPLPDSFGSETTMLVAGGIQVRAHVLGAGCSDAHVVVQYEDHVFVGDLVANGSHSWMELGHSDAWLARLEEIRALRPQHVHPGRGASGGPRLLDREAAYLRKINELVERERPTLPIPSGAIARLRGKVEEAYPGYDFAKFLDIGLPAEWERVARQQRTATKPLTEAQRAQP